MKKMLMLEKILVMLLALAMIFMLCACTVPAVQIQNEDGSMNVVGVLIEQVVDVIYRLIWAATLTFAAWALEKIGKTAKLKNLSIAIQSVCEITRQTTEELQQTIVNDLKAKRPGGKLTPEDMDDLGFRLHSLVKSKLDIATQQLIVAAGADLDALITGECEAFLNRLKAYAIPVPEPEPEPEPYDPTAE